MTISSNNYEYLKDIGEKKMKPHARNKYIHLSQWIPWVCTEFVSSKKKRQISSSFIEAELYLSQLFINNESSNQNYVKGMKQLGEILGFIESVYVPWNVTPLNSSGRSGT